MAAQSIWRRTLLLAPRNVLLPAVAALALAHPLPAGAEERSHAADVAYERGASAFRQGELETALDYLSRASQLAPDDAQILRHYSLALISSGEAGRAAGLLAAAADPAVEAPEVNYLQGLASYRTGDLLPAREGFERALRADPLHARAQLFLGSVLQEQGRRAEAKTALREAMRLDPALAPAASFRLGQLSLPDRPEQAREFFEAARDGASAAHLTRSAQRHLEALPRKRSRFRSSASAGFEYDSNANLVGDDPLLQSRRKRDVGGFVHAGLSARIVETEGFRLHAGLLGFLSNHADERDYDVQSSRASMFASAAVAPRLNADLLYFYESTWTDFDLYRQRHFVKPALRLRENRSNETRLFYAFEERAEFFRPLVPALDHEGQTRVLGLEHSLLLPDFAELGVPLAGRPLITAAFSRRRQVSDGSEYDSRSKIYGLSLRAPLPAEFDIELNTELEERDYDSPSVLEPFWGDRSDRIKRYSIGLGRNFEQGLRVDGIWRSTDWGSSVQGFQYERQVFTLMVSYAFE